MKRLGASIALVVLLFTIGLLIQGYDNRPIDGFDAVTTTVRSQTPSPARSQTAIVKEVHEGDVTSAVIMVRDQATRNERVVFTAPDAFRDITTEPHWLGDRYLLFTRSCGTACQGLVLLDTTTGETKSGTLSFSDSDDSETGPRIYLRDWFNRTFIIEGLLNKFYTEVDTNGIVWLILSTQDEDSTTTTPYRYIFDERTTVLTKVEP